MGLSLNPGEDGILRPSDGAVNTAQHDQPILEHGGRNIIVLYISLCF